MKRLVAVVAVAVLSSATVGEAADLRGWNLRSMLPQISIGQHQNHHFHRAQPGFTQSIRHYAIPTYSTATVNMWDHHAKPAHPHLYGCVKYRDLRNIAPCAKPMIVQVADPCACKCKRSCDPCAPCAPPKMVSVKICVPSCTCGPPCVTRSKCGKYVRYDFGKYAVDIRSKKGYVEVDYDD